MNNFYYWKVRIYNPVSTYSTCEVRTKKNLDDIQVIRDFYLFVTGGCNFVIEGMSESSNDAIPTISKSFQSLFTFKKE